MSAIATSEPTELVAGDTIAWRREDLADYPATAGWALSYELRNATKFVSIAGSLVVAAGAAFAVTVPAATSATWVAGVYTMAGFVTKGAERYQVFVGTVTIKPNLAIGGALDARSHARKVLDAIEAVIENRASKDQQSYRIGDRELVRMSADELINMRSLYRAEVRRDLRAERRARGLAVSNDIKVRFR